MERRFLSPRELEILTWSAKGKTYWEIARILGIAYSSVHSHINTLRLKLNAVNTTHAVARGYELGLIVLGTSEPRVILPVTTLIVRRQNTGPFIPKDGAASI